MQKEDMFQIVKTFLRSVAASFPVFASIAAWWAENETFIKEKRLDELFGAIKHQLARHEAKIATIEENDAKRKEEFCALLERTIERALTQVEKGKVAELARVFVGVHFKSQSLPFDERAWILDAIAELTVSDLGTLGHFLTKDYLQVNHLLPFGGVLMNPKKDETDLCRQYVSLKRLAARGIISDAPREGAGISSSTTFTKWTNSILSEAFRVTPFGKQIVAVLKETA